MCYNAATTLLLFAFYQCWICKTFSGVTHTVQCGWSARAATWSPAISISRASLKRGTTPILSLSTSVLCPLQSGRSSTPATTVRAADDVNQPWRSGNCVCVRRSSVVDHFRRWYNLVRVLCAPVVSAVSITYTFMAYLRSVDVNRRWRSQRPSNASPWYSWSRLLLTWTVDP